jgi:ribosome biogenesis protein ENP2
MASITMAGDGVTIYNLTVQRRIPAFASAKRQKALKNDPEFARRVELLQDFGFPSACHTIAQSNDGRYIVATGIYAPRVRIYDTAELSMKVERYMDATPVATAILGDDYKKLAFLQDDRGLELHAAYGKHFRTRIPTFGRCMSYHCPTAELLIGATGSHIYRLSLEEGRFAAPMMATVAARSGVIATAPTSSDAAGSAIGSVTDPGVNSLSVSRITALIAYGADGGYLGVIDPRTCKTVSRLMITKDASAALPQPASSSSAADQGIAVEPPLPDYAAFSDGTAITSVAFDDNNGLSLAAGTADGRVLLYDLRRAAPLLSKAHQYGLPIKKVMFHRRDAASASSASSRSGGGSNSGDLILSCDSKAVKLWNKDNVSSAL